MALTWLKINADSAQILLHVQPGARTSEIVGVHGDALKIRIAAAAIEGKANAAVCQFIANKLGICVTQVEVQRGSKSRRKIIKIAPLDKDITQKLEHLGSEHDEPA